MARSLTLCSVCLPSVLWFMVASLLYQRIQGQENGNGNETVQDTKYIQEHLGGTTVLSFDAINAIITEAAWSHSTNLTAKEDIAVYRSSLEPMYHPKWGNSLQLNETDGSLTIKQLQKNNSGKYEGQLHVDKNSVRRTYYLTVIGDPGDPATSTDSTGLVTGIVLVLLLIVGAVVAVYFWKRKNHFKKACGETIRFNSCIAATAEIADLKWTYREVDKKKVIAAFPVDTNDADYDKQFGCRCLLDKSNGSLLISDLQMEDSGVYEVDILLSNEKKIQKTFNLFINKDVRYKTGIIGQPVTLYLADLWMEDIETIKWSFMGLNRTSEEVRAYFDSRNDRVNLEERSLLNPDVEIRNASLFIRDLKDTDAGTYKVICKPKHGGQLKATFVLRCKIDSSKSVSGYLGMHIQLPIQISENDEICKLEWKYCQPDNDKLIATFPHETKVKADYDNMLLWKLRLNSRNGSLLIDNLQSSDKGRYIATIVLRNGHLISETFSLSILECQTINGCLTNEARFCLKTESVVQRSEWKFGPSEPDNTIFTYGHDTAGPEPQTNPRLKFKNSTGSLRIEQLKCDDEGVYQAEAVLQNQTQVMKFFGLILWEYRPVIGYLDKSVRFSLEICENAEIDKILWQFIIADQTRTIATYYPEGGYETNTEEIFANRLLLNRMDKCLRIEQLRASDEGIYRTTVFLNDSQRRRIEFHLTVWELVTIDRNLGMQANLNVDIPEGETVKELEWTFDDSDERTTIATYSIADGIEAELVWRLEGRISLNQVNGSLYIDKLQLKDGGIYRITVQLTNGKKIHKEFCLNVFDFESINLHDGATAYLQCNRPGDRTIKDITWKYLTRESDQPIATFSLSEGRRTDYVATLHSRLDLDEHTGTLSIRGLQLSDSGHYSASILLSEDQNVQKQYNLRVWEVHEIKEFVNETLCLSMGIPYQEACNIVKIEWIFGQYDPEKIATYTKTEGIKTDYQERLASRLQLNKINGSLVIRKLQPEDDGTYCCTVTFRDPPRRQREFHLHIWERINIHGTVEKSVELPLGFSVPVIMITWEFVRSEQEKVVIAQFPQERQDGELFNPRFQLDTKTGSLSIKALGNNDAGTYQALAVLQDNKRRQKQFDLKVWEYQAIDGQKGMPLIISPQIPEDGTVRQIKWIFTSSKKESTPSTIALFDRASGVLTHFEERFKNRLQLNESNGSLQIDNLKDEDKGIYQVAILLDDKRTIRRKFELTAVAGSETCPVQ